MKLPKKYQGITPGEWIANRGSEWGRSVVTMHGVLPDGSPNYWNVCSANTRREESDANLTLLADSPRLAAAVVELREALESLVLATGLTNGNAINALASTKEWEA